MYVKGENRNIESMEQLGEEKATKSVNDFIYKKFDSNNCIVFIPHKRKKKPTHTNRLGSKLGILCMKKIKMQKKKKNNGDVLHFAKSYLALPEEKANR